jgi:hypothetical protein
MRAVLCIAILFACLLVQVVHSKRIEAKILIIAGHQNTADDASTDITAAFHVMHY